MPSFLAIPVLFALPELSNLDSSWKLSDQAPCQISRTGDADGAPTTITRREGSLTISTVWWTRQYRFEADRVLGGTVDFHDEGSTGSIDHRSSYTWESGQLTRHEDATDSARWSQVLTYPDARTVVAEHRSTVTDARVDSIVTVTTEADQLLVSVDDGGDGTIDRSRRVLLDASGRPVRLASEDSQHESRWTWDGSGRIVTATASGPNYKLAYTFDYDCTE